MAHGFHGFHMDYTGEDKDLRFREAADLSLRWASVRGARRETVCRLCEVGRRREFA